jgi:toxin YoeB
MAKKEVKWTLKAVHDKLHILDYWISRNKSKIFSEKLDLLFDKSLESLLSHPEQGNKLQKHPIKDC